METVELTPTGGAPMGVPLGHGRVIVVFSGLLLAMLLAALDQTIVATALPTIVGELGGLEHISWIASAYLLAQTVVTPLYGKLGDLYGRKRVLQSAVVIFLAGSAARLSAQTNATPSTTAAPPMMKMGADDQS